MIPSRSRQMRAGLLSLALLSGLACAGVTADPSPAGHTYPRTFVEVVRPQPLQPPGPVLRLDWPAVNLAAQPPYDTAQLHAVLRTREGAVITNAPPVEYMTRDTEISVSATGLITTHHPTPLAHVIARVDYDGWTRADTAIVQVTADPLPGTLSTLSIHPQPGGLAGAYGNMNNSDYNIGFGAAVPFFATIAKPHADPHLAAYRICGAQGCPKYPLLVHFSSSDSTIAYIDKSGLFHPLKPGRVTFTISTVAYGVRKVDSLPFSVGYNQRKTTGVYVDSSRQSAAFVLRSLPGMSEGFSKPPYSVGLHVYIGNYTREPVEVTLLDAPHKAYFFDDGNNKALPDTRVTLADSGGTIAVLDSVGTHVLRYRGLTTGAVLNDTITVLPYP